MGPKEIAGKPYSLAIRTLAHGEAGAGGYAANILGTQAQASAELPDEEGNLSGLRA
jgi:hypothetical protein